ncbi:waprin-Thr1-like [Saccoglossus kowalevskii]
MSGTYKCVVFLLVAAVLVNVVYSKNDDDNNDGYMERRGKVTSCPPIEPDDVGTCSNNYSCDTDDDCKRKEKCCINACGSYTCVTAV